MKRDNISKKQRHTSKTALNLTGKDLRKMTRAEVADAVSALASAANKRLKRASQAGQPIEDTVEKFSTAGKSKQELMKEFTRAKNFMGNQRMSLSGQKKLARETAQGLTEKIAGTKRSDTEEGSKERKSYDKIRRQVGKALNTSVGAGNDQYDTFWKAYSRLVEKNGMIKENKALKYRVLKKQISIMAKNPQQSIDELHERMEKEFTAMYMAEQKEKEEETPEDAFTIRD